MEPIRIDPERQTEFVRFAKERGKDPATALDEAIVAYMDWAAEDFEDTVAGIERGLRDVEASRTRSAETFLAELSRKYDIPR